MNRKETEKAFNEKLAPLFKALPEVNVPAELKDNLERAALKQFEASKTTPLFSSVRVPLAVAAALLLVAAAYLRFSIVKTDAVEKAVQNSTIFEFTSARAQTVALAGDFNGWKTNTIKLKRVSDDRWRAEVKLDPGFYQYQFVINNKTFKTDPQSAFTVPDGFGGQNSGIEI